MAAVIIWCVKTKIAKQIFAGFVSVLGNLMDQVGTIAIDMMKRKQKQPEMLRKDLAQLYNVIYSTVIAT